MVSLKEFYEKHKEICRLLGGFEVDYMGDIDPLIRDKEKQTMKIIEKREDKEPFFEISENMINSYAKELFKENINNPNIKNSIENIINNEKPLIETFIEKNYKSSINITDYYNIIKKTSEKMYSIAIEEYKNNLDDNNLNELIDNINKEHYLKKKLNFGKNITKELFNERFSSWYETIIEYSEEFKK